MVALFSNIELKVHIFHALNLNLRMYAASCDQQLLAWGVDTIDCCHY